METKGVNSIGRAKCRTGEETPSSTSAGIAVASCTAATASAVSFSLITVFDDTTIGSYSSSASHGMRAESAAANLDHRRRLLIGQII